jgi:hypothetical protein
MHCHLTFLKESVLKTSYSENRTGYTRINVCQ